MVGRAGKGLVSQSTSSITSSSMTSSSSGRAMRIGGCEKEGAMMTIVRPG